jgi:hypothetical protein
MITTLFWIMCAVLGANVVVAVIAIAKAIKTSGPYHVNPGARRLGSRAW